MTVSVLLFGCGDGDKPAAETLPPTPTLFVATAGPAGIANPPQTARPGGGDSLRARAEAFLRRVAPTDADLPAGIGTPATTFRDSAALAALDPDPSGALTRLQRARFVLSAETNAEDASPTALPSDGRVLRVTHTGYAFEQASDTSIWAYLRAGPATMPMLAVQRLEGRATGVRIDRIEDLRLGDETLASRAHGAAPGLAGLEMVSWAIDVRRGPASILLLVDGAGPAVDRFARDLAGRLDQRLAAALAAGAWP